MHTDDVRRKAFTLVELLVVIGVIGILLAVLVPGLVRSKEIARPAACVDNLRQLTASTLTYASEQANGALTPDEGANYHVFPVFDQNWLWRYMMHGTGTPKVFFCPGTSQGQQLKLVHDKTTGLPTYADLIIPAGKRTDRIGHSYDTLPFFRDMENYWNGNEDFLRNSSPVRKTLSSIVTYKHGHEAFGLTGQSPGASRIWLYADVDSMRRAESFYPDPENNHGSNGLNVAFCDGHVQWLKQADVVYSHEFSQDNNRTRAYPRH